MFMSFWGATISHFSGWQAEKSCQWRMCDIIWATTRNSIPHSVFLIHLYICPSWSDDDEVRMRAHDSAKKRASPSRSLRDDTATRSGHDRTRSRFLTSQVSRSLFSLFKCPTVDYSLFCDHSHRRTRSLYSAGGPKRISRNQFDESFVQLLLFIMGIVLFSSFLSFFLS